MFARPSEKTALNPRERTDYCHFLFRVAEGVSPAVAASQLLTKTFGRLLLRDEDIKYDSLFTPAFPDSRRISHRIHSPIPVYRKA